ncbi:MAG: amino acid ABC transporter substrate-binding protein [Thermobacillus sp.]|jgi:putative amino-acid transport system substrate-binding protein|uniref:Periplasmic component of amino acid ABC-type transporter/signal transduction system n=2 Tax=Thermobacillus TaxID=76632 RepID=L0EIR0_THECK|nr:MULTISPECIES: amino acid ABC transporter substrate-binding protein [Thermobacillus]AGA59586.1 periplasmic component of amino acid ABC-type transporter/signal transduction system [Thermobacillus composti KWC4]REJ12132.1 MAG: amino acid ABC transporter substrate-binding protein [Paenibacillaceae bacterium]REK54612.1 MAG: amino acid ABC transporter substrate-binding protein [Thermobacillus sp.]CAG5087585.1 Amino acid ABC superfamily ATP binding cassette transporter, binding protein [Thermobacil
MKKLYFTLAVVLLFSVLAAACSSGKSGGDDDKKVLRAGSTGQSFPNSYKDGDKLVGFDVEVLETIAANLGYTVEWVNTDFSGLMGQLETGKIDTVANVVAVTEERKQKFDFTVPYSYAGVAIVTHVDNTDINTLEDLKGKTVAGVLGSQNVKNLQNYDPEINVRTYENRDGAQNDVLNKRVDGYVQSKANLIAEINKNNLPLKFVGEPFHYEDVAFPFVKSEKNQKLIEQFNAEIEKLREDGTLKKLSEKYFYGEDVTTKSE